jgi:hypothetical protein
MACRIRVARETELLRERCVRRTVPGVASQCFLEQVQCLLRAAKPHGNRARLMTRTRVGELGSDLPEQVRQSCQVFAEHFEFCREGIRFGSLLQRVQTLDEVVQRLGMIRIGGHSLAKPALGSGEVADFKRRSPTQCDCSR